MNRRTSDPPGLHRRAGAATAACVVVAGVLTLTGVPAARAEPEAAPVLEPESAKSEPRMLRYPPSSARGWVLGSGIGLTATAYGIGMACGFGWDDVPGADALKVPVVGPWVALGQSGCAPDQEECTAILVLRTILTTLDGLAQLGGVALVLEGVIMTTEADAPADERPSDGGRTSASVAPRVAVVPAVSPHHGGLALDVRF